MTEKKQKPIKVGMMSLGCAKNLVDAEVMLGGILAAGMEATSDTAEADVMIVNTCAFIDSAKEESIDAILDAHRRRGLVARPGQKLIVAGCMAQRFSKDLAAELPEVDAFIGLDQVPEIGDIIGDLLDRSGPSSPRGGSDRPPLDLVSPRPKYLPDYDTPRYRLTPPHTAYVKIAEGCNHPCSFCVIPKMRGRHRSRTIPSVIREIRDLVGGGVKEINLISQDTTYFGMDLWEGRVRPDQPIDRQRGPTLVDLLDEIAAVEGEFWVRLLYTHPAHWSDDLIDAIARNPKVARYIDMPLQHIHPQMLALMRRETGREEIVDLIGRIREGIPEVAIRTTFIVGFPGETEAEFEHLIEFIEATRFERLGIFQYSQEEGARSAAFEGQIPDRVKRTRFRRAMLAQQRIAAETAMRFVGQRVKVLADTPHHGRTEFDAPDIDGRVILSAPVEPGVFLDVSVTAAETYDLMANP
jgi:ribosomal protein S12 methylthiotransferase